MEQWTAKETIPKILSLSKATKLLLIQICVVIDNENNQATSQTQQAKFPLQVKSNRKQRNILCNWIIWGPSIKYVTLEGEGVRESLAVCDRGRGSRACDVTLIQIFIIHLKHEISSDV